MRALVAPLSVVVAVGALTAPCAVPLAAQGRYGGPEAQLLRDAARLESEGELRGAERALRSLLESDPTAAGAVFALGRVLRAQDRLGELLPVTDAYLVREHDAEIRGLRLRVLGETGDTVALAAEAERWMETAPEDEAAFLEVSGAYRDAFGPARALEVLRRGRATLGSTAMSLQVGDLLAESGDTDAAVDAWASAVGPTGSGAQDVRGRVQALEQDRDVAARRLVRILADSERALRRGVAARVAIELGLPAEAIELSRAYAEGLQGRARASFLEDVGRLGDEARLGAVSAWAYQRLRDDASSPGERRRLDLRVVNAALEAGDTASAVVAQRRVAASYPPDTDGSRAARARLIGLQVSSSEVDALRVAFLAFQRDHPDAPEMDALAASVAAALHDKGDTQGAQAVLTGVVGPRSALESAFLLLDRGDLEGAQTTFVLAVSGLPPAEATPVIQLFTLLGRLSEAGASALAGAGAEAHRGRGVAAARDLADSVGDLPPGDRSALLAQAGRMAESGGDAELAAQIRSRLVSDHPDAPEVPEAALALARHHVRSGGDRAEAVRLLEDLIVRSPNAAVVPEARLELERILGRGS